MNKFLTASLTLLLLFSFTAMIAQNCGTTEESQYIGVERLIQNRIHAEAQTGADSRDATSYVPIHFHIVSNSDGNFGVKETRALDIICNLNTTYEDQDMVFYMKDGFNYINHDNLFNDPGSNSALFQIQQNWNNTAINIFIVNNTPGSGGYYQPPFQAYPFEHIVFNKGQLDAAAHEVGHYFSLAHPFLGWGQASDSGWDPVIHGMQVGTYCPAGFPFENEKMNGSNCNTAADGICDTPPDYLFANSPLHNNDCNWDGGAMDPNGVVVVTMEENIMNYFLECPDQIFSADQKVAIKSDFNSPQRNYIRHTYVPNTEAITAAPELYAPIDGEITAGYNIVNFDWEDVAGADAYYLEIDKQPTFGFQPQRYVVTNGSSKDVEDTFNPNVTYYWRVTPYGESYNCDLPISDTQDFKTGESVSTKEIEAVNDWAVIPNPVRQSESLNIQLNADEAFDADIQLYNMTGQLIKNVSRHQFGFGANNYNFDISNVGTGMYILVVQSENGVNNKKVVITE